MTDSSVSASGRFLAAVVMLVVVSAIVGARLVTPSPQGVGTHEGLGLRPCSFLRWTSIPCPACGGTTAFTLMARGRVREALLTSPLGAATFAVLVVLLIPLARIVTGRSSPLITQLLGRPVLLVRPIIGLTVVSWLVVILRLHVGN